MKVKIKNIVFLLLLVNFLVTRPQEKVQQSLEHNENTVINQENIQNKQNQENSESISKVESLLLIIKSNIESLFTKEEAQLKEEVNNILNKYSDQTNNSLEGFTEEIFKTLFPEEKFESNEHAMPFIKKELKKRLENHLQKSDSSNNLEDIIILKDEEKAFAKNITNQLGKAIHLQLTNILQKIINNWNVYSKNLPQNQSSKALAELNGFLQELNKLATRVYSISKIETLTEVNTIMQRMIEIVDLISQGLKCGFKKTSKYNHKKPTIISSVLLLQSEYTKLESSIYNLAELQENSTKTFIQKAYISFQKLKQKALSYSPIKFIYQTVSARTIFGSLLFYDFYQASKNPEKHKSFIVDIIINIIAFASHTVEFLQKGNRPSSPEKGDNLIKTDAIPQLTPSSKIANATIWTLITQMLTEEVLWKKLGLEQYYNRFTSFLMDFFIAGNTEEYLEGTTAYSDYTLQHEMFSFLKRSNVISWFYDAMTMIQDPFSSNILDRVVLVEGPSGCGKTTVVEAFAESVRQLKLQNKTPYNVQYVKLTTELFDVKGGAENAGNSIFDYINEALTSAIAENKIMIIFLDEFHTFFGNTDQEVDMKRLHKFLEALENINTKQKNTNAGLYLILGTNRPDALPHELRQNRARIQRVINIPYPTKAFAQEYLYAHCQKLGIDVSNIDIEKIASVVQSTDRVTQGDFKKIFETAFEYAKQNSEVLTTKHFEKAINSVVRKITYSLESLNNTEQTYLAEYFAAQASVTLAINGVFRLDAFTIYPSLPKHKHIHIKDFYANPIDSLTLYGGLFLWKNHNNLLTCSEQMIMEKVYILLAGNIWNKKHGIPHILQSQLDMQEAIKIVKEYYCKYSFYSEDKAYELAQKYIQSCIPVLESLYEDSSFKNICVNIKEQLISEKFITAESLDQTIPSLQSSLAQFKNNFKYFF